jgi:hypothetical protein
MGSKIPVPQLGAVLDRSFTAFFIDARIDADGFNPAPYVLGYDVEDLVRDISWNETDITNVFDVQTVINKRGLETISVDPFKARKDDAMTELLMHLDERRAGLDNIKRRYYEVTLDDEGNVLSAFTQMADIKLSSKGGSGGEGVNMPFDISLSGDRRAVGYDLASNTFEELQSV